MGWGERKYTDAQRAAVIYHRNVRGLSGHVISNQARNGELESVTGDTLAAFEIPHNTVYSLGRDERAKLRRNEVSKLVHATPADANEEIRRRLIEITDRRTAKLVDDSRRGKNVDVEELRKLARAAREIAALPAYGLRAPQPGRQAAGAPEGETPARSSSMAGAMYEAARGGAIGPAPEDIHTPVQVEGSAADAGAGAGGADGAAGDGSGEGPGSRARSQISKITALAITPDS